MNTTGRPAPLLNDLQLNLKEKMLGDNITHSQRSVSQNDNISQTSKPKKNELIMKINIDQIEKTAFDILSQSRKNRKRRDSTTTIIT